MTDFNATIIEEFRANGGRVEQFGDRLLLLHHIGRTSGREYVAPLAYLSDPTDAGTVYVFASAAGAPKDPQWFDNVVAAGEVDVELGTETYRARVETLNGEERERIWAANVEQAPAFADYATKTEGIRVIPVVALHRVGRGSE